MTNITKTIVLAAALVAPWASHAVTVTLVLDDHDPTVVRPDTGSTTYNFTGTAEVSGYSSAWAFTMLFPYLQGNNTTNLTTNVHSDLIAGLNTMIGTNGGVYSGNLFSVTVWSTDDLGWYDHRFNSAEAPVVKTVFFDGSGGQASDSQGFMVNVSPVPEPATLVLLGAPLAIAALRRKKRLS